MWNWWRTVQTAAGIKQSYTKIISSPKAVYNIGYLGDKDIFNFEGLIQGSDQALSFLNDILHNNIKGQIHQTMCSIKDTFC